MKRRGGLSLVEVIVALAIFAVAVPTIYSAMASNYRHSVMSRNRVAANFLARSFFEEISAHPYGQPAPAGWPKATVGAAPSGPPANWETLGAPAVEELTIYVEDRPQKTVFHRQLSLKNGSLVGKGKSEGWDEVTLTITWTESGDSAEKSATSTLLVWSQDAPKP